MNKKPLVALSAIGLIVLGLTAGRAVAQDPQPTPDMQLPDPGARQTGDVQPAKPLLPHLTGAQNDIDTPERNATVWVDGCSGTLITSDVVLTAGHCIPNQQEPPEEWVPKTVTVVFGPDRNRPRLIMQARLANFSVGEDIALIRLQNQVPANVAIPKRVLLQGPLTNSSDFWKGQRYRMAGWGLDESGNAPSIRKTVGASNGMIPYTNFGVSLPNMLGVKGDNSATAQLGDSGGPLYWIDSRTGIEYVIGAAQGPTSVLDGYDGTGGRYVVTFGKGGPDGAGGMRPNISAWITRMIWDWNTRRMCGETRQSLVPFNSWWSSFREDNWATSQHAPLADQPLTPDYGYVRLEGCIYNPDLPKPPGTIQLFSWWSPSRGDNWVTTLFPNDGGKPLSPDYGFVRLEGYIFRPDLPQPPGTLPLYSWWSPSRSDNWITSLFPDRGGQPLTPDYGFVRLEGYVVVPGKHPHRAHLPTLVR
jgi:hypothetical protein